VKKVFVDSDVVLSSLLSFKGAANFLLNEVDLEFVISNISLLEIERGIIKLNLDKNQLTSLVKNRLKPIELKDSIMKIKKIFKSYVFDEDDAHIVAAAKRIKAKVILSYNLKHFNRQKIKDDLGIVVLTPAQYLQYLRSLD
jgi:predicted nucleic acid-binding protein